jgi:hypothetical protein
MRLGMLFSVVLLAACGDDSGPSGINYAGSYPGEFYAVASSTEPAERDSIPGGDVTLTLVRTDDDRYEFSSTGLSGSPVDDLTINDAGAVSFPAFDEPASLDLISSLLTGICDLSDAMATPSGSVVNDRLTITVLASGGTCDWSAGLGADVRPTDIQLTWTGTKS